MNQITLCSILEIIFSYDMIKVYAFITFKKYNKIITKDNANIVNVCNIKAIKVMELLIAIRISRSQDKW